MSNKLMANKRHFYNFVTYDACSWLRAENNVMKINQSVYWYMTFLQLGMTKQNL